MKYLTECTPELLWGLCEFLCFLAFFFSLEVCYAHYFYSYARIGIHMYLLSTFPLCVAVFVIWSFFVYRIRVKMYYMFCNCVFSRLFCLFVVLV